MSDTTSPWTRRRLLRTTALAGLGAAGLSLAAACGGGQTGAEGGAPEGLARVRVALGWITNVEFAGFWVAQNRGYYAQEGLEVEFIPGGPNAPEPTQTMAAGGADVAIPVALQAFISAVNEGNDFVAYGSMFQSAPSAVLSLAARPVRSAADIVDTTVLGQQGVQPYIDAAMRLAGVPTRYRFLPAGFEPSPLLEGQGEVYTCFATNQPITLEQQGLREGTDFFVTTYEQMGLPQYAGIVCSQRSWLTANRDTVVRFMRASVRGWQDNQADPLLAPRLAVEEYGADLGLDLAQQNRENELQIGFTRSELTDRAGLLRMDPARLGGPMYRAFAAAGITPLPPPEQVVDTTVLDAVFQGRAAV